jgi:hypothetical protein
MPICAQIESEHRQRAATQRMDERGLVGISMPRTRTRSAFRVVTKRHAAAAHDDATQPPTVSNDMLQTSEQHADAMQHAGAMQHDATTTQTQDDDALQLRPIRVDQLTLNVQSLFAVDD